MDVLMDSSTAFVFEAADPDSNISVSRSSLEARIDDPGGCLQWYPECICRYRGMWFYICSTTTYILNETSI